MVQQENGATILHNTTCAHDITVAGFFPKGQPCTGKAPPGEPLQLAARAGLAGRFEA
jgi:hypothetical protein